MELTKAELAICAVALQETAEALQLGIDAAKRRNWYLPDDIEATKQRMIDLRERILAQSIPHRTITVS